MARVEARLNVAESEYATAQTLEEQRRMLTASAGVSFSACPMQKDLTRRGAVGLTYRRMDTYGERKEEFAGGNTISLSTLTPMVSWRPLFQVANGKYDYVDLATGGGFYWLSSTVRGRAGSIRSAESSSNRYASICMRRRSATERDSRGDWSPRRASASATRSSRRGSTPTPSGRRDSRNSRNGSEASG